MASASLSIGRASKVVEELFESRPGCGMSFDLALPAAGGGVFDELPLDLQARA